MSKQRDAVEVVVRFFLGSATLPSGMVGSYVTHVLISHATHVWLRFLLAKLRAHDGEQRPHLAGIYPNGITKPHDCMYAES